MDFVTQYFEATTEERVNLIFRHYDNFLDMVAAGIQEVIFIINEEIDYNRLRDSLEYTRTSSGTVSDPTYRKAVQRVSVEEAVKTCSFDNDALDGVEHRQAFIRRAYNLRKMQRDFEVVADNIQALKQQDRDYLLPVLLNEKTIEEIAIESSVSYGTVATRICRLKSYVRGNVSNLYTHNITWLD